MESRKNEEIFRKIGYFSHFLDYLKYLPIYVYQNIKTTQKIVQVVIFDVKFAADYALGVSLSIFFKENSENQKNLENYSDEKLSIIKIISCFFNFP